MRRRRPHATHADDWLITYADTITLLLCLFAVLFASALNKNFERKPVTPTADASPTTAAPPKTQPIPIQPPDILEGNLPMHGIAHASERTADTDEAAPTPPPRPIPHRPTAPTPTISSAALRQRLQSQGTQINEQSGERIHTLQISSNAFFAPGSATLSDSGKTVLREVAASLKTPRFDGYQITVEGHTDDEPITSGPFPSNWELSTARAAAVVRAFIGSGIPAFRLRAAGYADTFPTAPNRDASGRAIRENQAKNRRVVIRLDREE
jgi:chemotaxis protein MotB